MTSIRARIKVLIASRRSPVHTESEKSGPRPSDYAYTLYWTRLARGWGASRRAELTSSVEAAVSDPDFRPNEFFRVYTLPGLDESAHAGASLQALLQVLKAFDRNEAQGEFDD
jgi:hypothetical protein